MSLLNLPFNGAHTFFIDPLFDLRLGNYNTDNLIKGASQIALLFPAATERSDSIISNINIKSDFYEYLSENVGDCGRLIEMKLINKDDNFLFWGWDKYSSKFTKEKLLSTSYPDYEVVAKVNSRNFCFNFNQITKTGIPDSNYCRNINELNLVIKKYRDKSIVVKPDYGNAGYGFIRLTDGVLTKEYSTTLNDLFDKGNGVVVEEWLERTADISSGFILSNKGKVLKRWHHQTLCNSVGTYFANYVLNDDPLIKKYIAKLEQIIDSMAKELHHVGYYGPVGFDSFEYKTADGDIRFAPAIEINARMNVGMIARSILDKVSDNKPSFFRFISKKRHKLPGNYEDLKNILGDLKYDKDRKNGVILITPLRVDYGDGPVRTARSAFTVTAETDEELWAMDDELRRRLK